MTWACISILAVSGGFGGFIAALRNPFANSLRLPFWSATLNLGCLGDVFVGVAAALVSYTFLGMLPTSGPVSTTNLSEEIALKFVGLGIAAGYAGIRILDRAALEMLRAKQDQLAQDVEVAKLLDAARDLKQKKHYKQAAELFERVLEIEPENEDGKIGFATASSYINEQDHALPIKILSEVVAKNPRAVEAFYNRACIKALNLGAYSKEDVLADLREAINIDGSYKHYAVTDIDFKKLVDTPEFQAIVGK